MLLKGVDVFGMKLKPIDWYEMKLEVCQRYLDLP